MDSSPRSWHRVPILRLIGIIFWCIGIVFSLALIVSNLFSLGLSSYSLDPQVRTLNPVLELIHREKINEAKDRVVSLLATEWLRDSTRAPLSELLGDISYRQGDLTGALISYQSSLTLLPLSRVEEKIRLLEGKKTETPQTQSWSLSWEEKSTSSWSDILSERIETLRGYQKDRVDSLNLNTQSKEESLREIQSLIDTVYDTGSLGVTQDW